MTWTKIIREDTFEGSDSPFVSITESHITFNALFVRIAAIDVSCFVSVYIDAENRKLGFKFHKEKEVGAYTLTAKTGRNNSSLSFSSRGFLSKYPWLAAISKLNMKDKRFPPQKEGGIWSIQLCPAFEIKKARESEDMPSAHTGIYRYLRESGEIVYIGRGNVKERLCEVQRREWDFDKIEYSLINNPDEQVKWEDYWIQRFKDENGKIPYYNRISGSGKHRE